MDFPLPGFLSENKYLYIYILEYIHTVHTVYLSQINSDIFGQNMCCLCTPCPKNNLKLRIKNRKPVTAGADAPVYVWLLFTYSYIFTQTIHMPLHRTRCVQIFWYSSTIGPYFQTLCELLKQNIQIQQSFFLSSIHRAIYYKHSVYRML